ncbi:vacuolar membrane protein [Colletotrichum sojae]|uniref:Vacuolar membrane protein n=1 Tax=Colletotrichum sojae TaxID=2175907 RepID=A0A8H6MYB2_9PEZI|nr:vacuolar membrane protein [Colletotrichum sojae]
MSIKPLPEDVVRRIRSSAAIVSLNGVVCGLVKNSFDAGATRINVTVDYSRGNCTIEDDGQGILPLEFRDAGGLGKLYHTSRHAPENETHGANGNFLASLAALSLLSITSHHHLHNSQNSLTVHNSRVLARNLPALPEQQLVTFAHGTRVIVRDLFGSMAVRVKQRALASEKAAVDREWGRLVHDVTALLLAWPSPVALVVRDTLHKSETRFRPNTWSRPITKPDFLGRSSLILAQSSLVDNLEHASWIPVGASLGKMTIEGCISLNPVATRRAQFISLGIQPVANEHGSNVLYTEVNNVFVKSGFAIDEGANALSDGGATLPTTTGKITRPKRGLDRWPMFYFRISSSSLDWSTPTTSFEDLLEDRGRTLPDMIELLKLVSYEFLKRHHFRPQKINTTLLGSKRKNKETGSDSESPRQGGKRSNPPSVASNRSRSATPKSRPESPFDLWQRVKIGRASACSGKSIASSSGLSGLGRGDERVSSVETSRASTPPPSLRFLDDSGNVLRRPFENLPSLAPSKDIANEDDGCGAKGPLDDSGKEMSAEPEVPRPLNTEGLRRSDESADLADPRNTTSSGVSLHFQRFKKKSAHPKEEPSDWFKGVTSNWQNPVFRPAQPPVPRNGEASFGGGAAKLAPEAGDVGCSHKQDFNIKLSGRISKAALTEAEVVAQVDRKFVLVKLARETDARDKRQRLDDLSVLVLIDQHAGDERCRLEALMQDYFEAQEGSDNVVSRTERLDKSLQFEFSAKERSLLRIYSDHFRRWGIVYRVEEPETSQWRHKSKQLCKIEVVGLPPSILERCRTEPKILADLLRAEAWKLQEEGRPPVRPFNLVRGSSGQEIDWISNFHGCPQGILDLLNSRSCRSAIMFNDVLSMPECEALVRRLGRCSFPFQCAHGRPSMVPLMDTRSLNIDRGASMQTFGSRLKQPGWTT